MKKSSGKFFSIRSKLLLIFFAVILTIIANSISMYISVSGIEKAHSKVTDSIYELNNLISDKKKIDKLVELFAETKDRDYIDKLYGKIQDFKINLNNVGNYSLESQMYLKNVKNMYKFSYEKYLDELIYSVRVGDSEKINYNYLKILDISYYIEEYLNMSLKDRIVESQKINEKISKNSEIIIRNNIFTMILMIAFLGIILFINGGVLVNKITDLVYAAEKVSEGEFNIKKLSETGDDEITLLSIAFNKLIKNTSELIEKIKENANLEIELHKKEAESHKIEALLNEAELMGLQSQINPHFLFNTLNIIAKTAVIEDAEKTCKLIETVSDMFRYNLRKITETTKLREEIENIENYFFIQKNRFGKRVKYEINVSDDVLDFEIPFLTLQPIVENAFIHGIEPLEVGGKIEINIYKKEEEIFIIIKDNGLGMKKEKIYELLNSENVQKGHTTGIGFTNVKRRLEIFFKNRINIEIKSEVGVGTEFSIRIKDI